MFFHDKRLQYNAKPDKPDPLYAKKLQEILGGQWGEMSVALQYLFQAWNCRGPSKYRDMLLDIGAEELGHIEMLATMIARLLEGAPVEDQEAAVRSNSMVAAVMGGASPQDAVLAGSMNPQHLIVNGLGASPNDSVGFPWTARYITSSGNLLADFRLNLTAESQGRLQAVRLYQITEDSGVRDMLAWLIARDAMHQNMWLAAIQEIEQDGLDRTPVPALFDRSQEIEPAAYEYWHLSSGTESKKGSWATGPTPDKSGQFSFLERPEPRGPIPELSGGNPLVFGTDGVTLQGQPPRGRGKPQAGAETRM